MVNRTITDESGQIQTKEQRMATVQDVLENSNVRKALTDLLPNNIDPNRFARIAMSSLRRNPALLQCNPPSFLSALLQSATLGLEPDTALGHSYLIPYGKEATLIVGYEGYIDLAYRSGVVTSIHANVVREDDDFDWGEGSEPFVKHKPKAVPQSYTQGRQIYMSGRDVTHAYAIARLLGGGHVQVVMMKQELDAIKSRSRASHDGPWVTDPIAMYKKTAIRQLRKFLPMSPQARALHVAAGLDEQADAGLSQTFEVPESVFEYDNEPIAVDTVDASETQFEPGTDDLPTEHGRCIIHGGAWNLNKYGYSHKNGSEYCTPSKAALEMATGAGISEPDLNSFLKDRFGVTRSRVELEHLDAIKIFVSLPQASQNASDDDSDIHVPDGESWPE